MIIIISLLLLMVLNFLVILPYSLNSVNASPFVFDKNTIVFLLDGKVIPHKNYIQLLNSYPNVLVGDVTAKLPCDDNGEAELEIARGRYNAIKKDVNGSGGFTADVPKVNLTLIIEASVIGKMCSYYTSIHSGEYYISDLALINPTQNNITLPDTSSLIIHYIFKVGTQDSDIISILLDGKVIPQKDFISIFNSDVVSIENGEYSTKLPCDDNGEAELEIMGHNISSSSISINLKLIEEVSIVGKMCMYRGNIPTSLTNIALINPTLNNITLPDTSSINLIISKYEDIVN